MSFLSKLLSGKKPSLNDVVELFQGKEKPVSKPAAQTFAPAWQPQSAQAAPVPKGPSGFSWGETMPDEPNQFNYSGTYWQYFEDIFHKEFAAYTVTRQDNPFSGSAIAYYFSQGGGTLLTVELVSQHCDVYKLRRDCGKQGIPYLRFYYDHDGWWNTRAYVVQRITKALG